MKDKATKRFQKCQFPFKFKGKTHNGCIDFIDIRNGKKVPGEPWCSTKVRGSDRKHVEGGGHYGNCGRKCPMPDRTGKQKQQLQQYQYLFICKVSTYTTLKLYVIIFLLQETIFCKCT